MTAWRKTNDRRDLVGRPWRRLRERILARDRYLCVACFKRGRLTEATEVDHLVPVSRGGRSEPANLQSLCVACHQAKTITDRGGTPRRRIDVSGWPVDD